MFIILIIMLIFLIAGIFSDFSNKKSKIYKSGEIWDVSEFNVRNLSNDDYNNLFYNEDDNCVKIRDRREVVLSTRL